LPFNISGDPYEHVPKKLSIYYLENDENDDLLLQRAFQKIGIRDCIKWFQFSTDLCTALDGLEPAAWPDLFLLDLSNSLPSKTGQFWRLP
jgi:hypothetical protein